ncbi:hypothetical protein U9M48_000838 [Paspalum notatum var. saurae]|uniref:Reverse transcriptase/retrotransposon-derived protein RNase H-like domain-containing protein n=1 Tax=Paspalum notatum var. saurae TaxID=547442 RepID=A0AAQ3PEB4_PASNO
MPDIDKPFTVDWDASGVGFGAVLHQGTGLLAFFSRPFAAHHLKLAAYEWELIGLVQAVRHWHPYLWVVPSSSAPTTTASSTCWTSASPRCHSISGSASSSGSTSPWSIARAG